MPWAANGSGLHAYLGHLADAEIVFMLNDLMAELGAARGKVRFHEAVGDRNWLLDAEGLDNFV